MAEITLLRHGQASFGAVNYDQLSELGYQQAQWLGAHLKSLGREFDAVVIGTMDRHRQTAEGFFKGLGQQPEYTCNPGLNEYNFKGLLNPFRDLQPQRWVASGNARRDYNDNLKQALAAWMDGRIADDGEHSWQDFHRRVTDVYRTVCASSAKKTLIVSSGGPISTIIAEVLRLDHAGLREINMQIRNTSTSRILHNRKSFALDSFNDISHLQSPRRQHAITFT